MRKVYSDILLQNYENEVKNLIADKQRFQQVLNYIGKYIDRNSPILSYPAPTKRLQFNTTGPDGAIILDSLHMVDLKSVKKTINSIERAKKKAGVLKEPLVVGLTLILRELTLQKKTKEAEIIMIYLVLAFYWSIQFRQFKFEPAEAAVTYTLNTASNRFYFKSTGTLLKALAITAEVNHDTSLKHLVSRDDDDIITYIMNLRTRISSLVVRFANLLYENLEKGEYLNSVRDNSEEEGYYEVQNISGYISNLTSKTTLDFYRYKIDPKATRVAAHLSGGITVNRLLPILEDIKGKADREVVSKIFNNLLMVYLGDGTTAIDSVGSKAFLAKLITAFSHGNTSNEALLEIRDILETFLNTYSETYLHSTRKATKNAYKKGIYAYFVLHIMNTVNHK